MTGNCMRETLSVDERLLSAEDYKMKQELTLSYGREVPPENAKKQLEERLTELKATMAQNRQEVQALLTHIDAANEELTLCRILLRLDPKKESREPKSRRVIVNWNRVGQQVFKALMQLGEYQDSVHPKLNYQEIAKHLQTIFGHISPRNL